MKRTLLNTSISTCLLVFMLQIPAHAQEGKRMTQVFFEYGGTSPAYSINIDSRFAESNKGLGARIGVGYQWDGPQEAWSIPLQVNYLLGRTKHFFEPALGLAYYYNNQVGSTWGMNSNEGSSIYGSLSLGYRYQPLRRGFTGRAGVAGLYGSFIPFIVPYASVGYAF
jgi:hypothetical protein